MGSKPRNVRYFPKMKVRGRFNKRRESFLRAVGAFDRLNVSATKAAISFNNLAKLVLNNV